MLDWMNGVELALILIPIIFIAMMRLVVLPAVQQGRIAKMKRNRSAA